MSSTEFYGGQKKKTVLLSVTHVPVDQQVVSLGDPPVISA